MLHTSRIELSQSAYAKNFEFIQQTLSKNCRYSSVVKGNAYGHGIAQFVPMVEAFGVDHYSVFSAIEADEVLKAADNQPTVMVMGMLDLPQLEWAIGHDVEFFVFDKDRLNHAQRIAQKMGKQAKIHLEIETGMNRTGIQEHELKEVLSFISKADSIAFNGLCTHYAGAESISNYYRVQQQIKKFDELQQRIYDAGLTPKLHHTACSAASIRYPETQMDLARIGILQYGFFPTREVLVDYQTKHEMHEEPLKRIISWKSQLMDVRTVKKGEFVGYGTSFLANEDMTVGLIPIGYSNGFSRSLSNQGRVLVRGERVSVIGMVNMNMLSVDLTTVYGAEKGDEVVLIGKQGQQEISVASFGEFSDQVNYELLTRLPKDIPRMVVD